MAMHKKFTLHVFGGSFIWLGRDLRNAHRAHARTSPCFVTLSASSFLSASIVSKFETRFAQGHVP